MFTSPSLIGVGQGRVAADDILTAVTTFSDAYKQGTETGTSLRSLVTGRPVPITSGNNVPLLGLGLPEGNSLLWLLGGLAVLLFLNKRHR